MAKKVTSTPPIYPVTVQTLDGEVVGFTNLREAIDFLQTPYMAKKEKRMSASFGGKLPMALKQRLVEKAEREKLSQVSIARAGVIWLTATDVERARMLAKLLEKKQVRAALIKATRSKKPVKSKRHLVGA